MKKTFSRPVRSGWKPVPTSSSAPARPQTRASPDVGSVTPERIFSSVVLPAPLRPMIPSTSPRGDVEADAAERRELFAVGARGAARQVERGARAADDRVAQGSVEDVPLAEPVRLAQITNGEREVRRCLQRHAPAA